MVKHFFAIFESYYPNSAPTNRMLSYVKAWEQMDVKVTVIFMLPNRMFSQLTIGNDKIKVLYLWKKIPFRNYLIHHILYFFNVIQLLKIIKKEDRIFVYGQPHIVSLLMKNRYDEVYHERNENPEVVNLSGRWPYRTSYKEYISACNHIRGIFVISTALQSYFIHRGVDTNHIYIINMTVDVDRFINIKKEKNIKQYVAYCGNASNKKDGVDLLINAFSLLHKKFPNLYLYVIGRHSHDVDKNKMLAKTLGVYDNVIFTGEVSFKEMPQLLTNATILALDRPRNLQAQYGFPTKLGEYLMTGNPVVVTDVGDVSKFLEDKVSSMIAHSNHPEEFAEKMEWLLKHPVEAHKIGENGKMVATKYFNNITESKKIINVMFEAFKDGKNQES